MFVVALIPAGLTNYLITNRTPHASSVAFLFFFIRSPFLIHAITHSAPTASFAQVHHVNYFTAFAGSHFLPALVLYGSCPLPPSTTNMSYSIGVPIDAEVAALAITWNKRITSHIFRPLLTYPVQT